MPWTRGHPIIITIILSFFYHCILDVVCNLSFKFIISELTKSISRPEVETKVHYPKILLFKLDAMTGWDLETVSSGVRVRVFCLQYGVGTKHLVSR